MAQIVMKESGHRPLIAERRRRSKATDLSIKNANLEVFETEDAVDPTIEKELLLKDLRRYLSSSAFYDIGPVTARRIVSHFGIRTVKVIKSSLHELLQVRGVGRMRMLAVKKGWAFQRDLVTRSAALAERESHQDNA
ncbi:MAG: hypothetical protein M0Z71_10435 [Nitrospiraceae bacterium]|nr:hypothetical protein [Nitrospiraceae bacterium]